MSFQSLINPERRRKSTGFITSGRNLSNIKYVEDTGLIANPESQL